MLPHPFCSVHGCVSRRGKGDRCQSRLNVPILARLLLFLLLDFPLCVPGKGFPTRSSFQYIDFFSSVDRPKSNGTFLMLKNWRMSFLGDFSPPHSLHFHIGMEQGQILLLPPPPKLPSHLIISPPPLHSRHGWRGERGMETPEAGHFFIGSFSSFGGGGGRETVTRPFRAFKRGRRG